MMIHTSTCRLTTLHRTLFLITLVVAIVAAGCAEQSDATEIVRVTPTTEAVADDGELEEEESSDDSAYYDEMDSEFSGQFVVSYDEVTVPENERSAALLRDHRILEDFAELMNASLYVPNDISVVASECEEANAWWDPEERSITYCYELTAEELLLFEAADFAGDEAIDMAVKSARGTMFHEAGHALISELELPITGREEDVADQLAAYMLTDDAEHSEHLVAIAVSYFAMASYYTEIDELAMGDVHSLDAQRASTFLCYAYGAYPDDFEHLVDEELLPQDRADWCSDEFTQLVNAWNALLEDYWRE